MRAAVFQTFHLIGAQAGASDMFNEIEKVVPKGWTWSLYSGASPRAVLVSPDWRIHIGRDGKTLEQALRSAGEAARSGERE